MALFDCILENMLYENGSDKSSSEKFIKNKLYHLVPNADVFEVRANIGDSSHSIEFFATIKGKKYQCYDLVDIGLIDEHKLDKTFNDIAITIRKNPEYNKGKINKYTFTIKK